MDLDDPKAEPDLPGFTPWRQAAEGLQGWSVAVERGWQVGDLAPVMQAYPSLASGNQQLAWAAHLDGLTSGITGPVLRWPAA